MPVRLTSCVENAPTRLCSLSLITQSSFVTSSRLQPGVGTCADVKLPEHLFSSRRLAGSLDSNRSLLNTRRHCKQLAPKWRKLADALHGVVRVSAVNCEEQKDVCAARGIQGYPTIKAFKGGQWLDYNGERSASAIKDWALASLPMDHVRVLTDDKALQGFLKASQTTGVARWSVGVVLLTDKSTTSALYKSLSMRYKGRIAFGEVRRKSSMVMSQFGERGAEKGSKLVGVCGGDVRFTVPFEGEMKNSELVKWLNGFYNSDRCMDAMGGGDALDRATVEKMKVGVLKQLLRSKNADCEDCIERKDFVARVIEVLGLS